MGLVVALSISIQATEAERDTTPKALRRFWKFKPPCEHAVCTMLYISFLAVP